MTDVRKSQMRGYANNRWRTDPDYREKSLLRGKAMRRDPGSWSIAAATSIKARAKKRGIPFNIDSSDIAVPEVCPVFGTPFVFGIKNHPQSPSVDRYKPEKGYVKGNVQVISYRANTLKRDSVSGDELRRVADYIDRCHKSECPSSTNKSAPSSTPSKG